MLPAYSENDTCIWQFKSSGIQTFVTKLKSHKSTHQIYSHLQTGNFSFQDLKKQKDMYLIFFKF